MARGSTFLLVALVALASCSSPPRAEPGGISAPSSVDPRAIERVTRIARDVRAWLVARYGPPRSEPASIRLVPDPHWFADEPSLERHVGWELSDPSAGIDDPPTILLAPCFGSYARPGALARWIFYVEWTRGLAPWLREGLSDTVAAALAADAHPDQCDATLEGLLSPWLGGARAPFADPAALVALDAERAARAGADAERLVSAATDGGEAALVRALVVSPPRTAEEVAALEGVARARAARFPSLARLARALDEQPRASSTTALLEAATPPATADQRDLPDAARDRGALESALVALAASTSPEKRRLAVYGLGRLGARSDLVARALSDRSFHVRVAALGASARAAAPAPARPERGTREAGPESKDLARRLLELAKDGPVEEAPGRTLPVLELFDRLTGFVEPPAVEPAELSLPARGRGAPASWRAIALRAAFLRGER